MSTQITTLGVKVISTGAGKAKREINSIGTAASKVKKNVALLGSALVALGVGKVLKDAIKYTASIEDLRIQLKFLTGSTKNASKAFSEMTKFASETPFALQDIQKSSASLLVAVGNDVDKLGNILQITGEISAQFGLSFQQTAQQLQKVMSAGAGAADTFREKGVLAMMGFRAGVKVSIEESEKIIKKWAESNKGAIDELKNTFTGKVSMMGDAWDKLLLTFGEAGILDEAKESVSSITEFLKDPATIKLAKSLANVFVDMSKAIGGSVVGLRNFLLFMVENNNAEAKAVQIAMDKIKAEKELANIRRTGKLPEYSSSDAMSNLEKSMQMSADFAKSERERVKEASKLDKKQWEGVLKITNNVTRITDKLTKKKTELEKITEAQITAEKLLSAQFKNSKITLEQYTEGLNIMKTEIQNYADVIEKIAFDKKMEKMAQSMEDSITDSLMNMGEGLNSFKDLATGIFRGIALEMVRVQISKPLASAASGFLGNMFGSMFGAPSKSAPISDLRPPTFAGGGFTGGGSRSGGIDGQGGFPAILHPNETVIDHKKGQSASSTNNITVNYSPQINALDPRTAAIVIAENAPTVVGIIRQAFNRNGQSVSI